MCLIFRGASARVAARPGWVLHPEDEPLHRLRRGPGSTRLHVILNSSIRRVRPLRHTPPPYSVDPNNNLLVSCLHLSKDTCGPIPNWTQERNTIFWHSFLRLPCKFNSQWVASIAYCGFRRLNSMKTIDRLKKLSQQRVSFLVSHFVWGNYGLKYVCCVNSYSIEVTALSSIWKRENHFIFSDQPNAPFMPKERIKLQPHLVFNQRAKTFVLVQ